MTTTVRTRDDIAADIAAKRRERLLYVSPEGVAKCHEAIDALLAEWEAAPPQRHNLVCGICGDPAGEDLRVCHGCEGR